MAYFKNVRLSEFRTANYRFSVETKDDKDLLALKKDIADQNAYARHEIRNGGKMRGYKTPYGFEVQRVILMGRGPRRDKDGFLYHSNADCSLRHEFAEYFDVYVTGDSTAMWMLRRERDTGLTSGQLKKMDALDRARWKQEMAEAAELRKQGIVVFSTNGQKHYMTQEKYVEYLREQHPNMPESIIQRLS